MSEKPFKSATQMDDELADFTDKVMSGEPGAEADVDELRSLQAVVSRLGARPHSSPPQAAMERIEKRLIAEWQDSQPSQNAISTFWRKSLQGIRSLTSQPRRILVPALVIIVLLVMVVSPFNQVVVSNFEATAGASDQNQWFVFIGAVVLVIGLLWFGRRKS